MTTLSKCLKDKKEIIIIFFACGRGGDSSLFMDFLINKHFPLAFLLILTEEYGAIDGIKNPF